jgi:hypothetical protein
MRPGVHYRISSRKATTGQKFYIAPNPQSSGATVLFYLKDDVDPAAIKVEVLDTQAAQALKLQIAQAVRDVTKLRGDIELCASGSLPNDGKVIEDARSYA